MLFLPQRNLCKIAKLKYCPNTPKCKHKSCRESANNNRLWIGSEMAELWEEYCYKSVEIWDICLFSLISLVQCVRHFTNNLQIILQLNVLLLLLQLFLAFCQLAVIPVRLNKAISPFTPRIKPFFNKFSCKF